MAYDFPDYTGETELQNEIAIIGAINLINVIKTIEKIERIVKINRIDLVDIINTINLINTISLITNVKNIESVDLIDKITEITKINPDVTHNVVINLVDLITKISEITDVKSVDLIDKITEITKINPDVTHNVVINLVDLITKISEITTVKTIDKVTLIDLITKISEITTVKSVDVANIKTSGGLNIVIDKLVQGAYTENRNYLRNYGTVASFNNCTGNNRHGKFFPRGCRGSIFQIGVYCRDVGATGGTITVYLYPKMGMGAVYSANITIPAGGAEAWRWAVFYKFWDYDSMLIGVVGSTTDMQEAYDGGTPYDGWDTSNNWATWGHSDGRRWIQVGMFAQSIGDLPVSGTINTVELPNLSVAAATAYLAVHTDTETVLVTINGAGTLLSLLFRSVHTDGQCRIYIDGTLVSTYTPSAMGVQGFGIYTPGVSLISVTPGASANDIWIILPYKFRRVIEVRGYQATGGNVDMLAVMNVNKI